MTTPPLPESPVLRVRLDYAQADAALAGNRFYIGYTGSAPTPGNCATLASDVAAAWVSAVADLVYVDYALTEVDVLDITTLTGASGQWTGDNAGGSTGTQIPASAASNCEFGIARRYRGGKPRIYWPAPSASNMLDAGHWTEDFTGIIGSATTAFFAAIAALDIGAMGVLSHVNVSYYDGFTNVTNSSGRTRAAPKYRTAALVEPVESYIPKAEISSQRRRRVATAY